MSEALRTVCAWCGKVRTSSGEWRHLADAAERQTDGRATHGICTSCLERTTPEAAAAH